MNESGRTREAEARYNLSQDGEAVLIHDKDAGERAPQVLAMSEQHKDYQAKPGENMSWRDPMTPWVKIHDEYLPAEMRAREALTEQVRGELA